MLPTTASGPVDLKKKFPGLERRKFALPQKFVSLQSIENIEAQMQNDVRNSRAGNSSNKIGFFHLNQTNDDASSSEDEYSGGGFQSDSSSDSTTSESDDGIVFPSTGTPITVEPKITIWIYIFFLPLIISNGLIFSIRYLD